MPASDSITKSSEVKGGLFSTMLDFGYEALDASEVYLEIQVKPLGEDTTTLSPRQRITAAPLALQASGATVRRDGVLFRRGNGLDPVTLVSNPGPADGYELDNAFTQVFTPDRTGVLNSIEIEMKRPLADTDPPSVYIYEGVGTGGEFLEFVRASWESPTTGGIQNIIADFREDRLSLTSGQPYTFKLRPSDSSVSRAPATGQGVGDSSGGAGVASVFRVSVSTDFEIGADVRSYRDGLKAGRLSLNDVHISSFDDDGDLNIVSYNPSVRMYAFDNFPQG